jgi:hypothetical protein
MAFFNFDTSSSRFGKLFRNSKFDSSRGKHSRHFVKCTCSFDVPAKPCLWYHLSDAPK